MTPPLPKRSGPATPDGRPTPPPQDPTAPGPVPGDTTGPLNGFPPPSANPGSPAAPGSVPGGTAPHAPGTDGAFNGLRTPSQDPTASAASGGATPHDSGTTGPLNGFAPPADDSVPEAERTAADPGEPARPWWTRGTPTGGTADPTSERTAADGAPSNGSPAGGSSPGPHGPGSGTPGSGTPGSDTSGSGAPGSGASSLGTHGSGTPGSTTAGFGTSGFGTSSSGIPEAERTATDAPGPLGQAPGATPGSSPYGPGGAPFSSATGPGDGDGGSAMPPFGTPGGGPGGGPSQGSSVPPADGRGRSPHDVPSYGPAGEHVGGVHDAAAEHAMNSDATSPTSVPSPGAPASEADEQKVTFEAANGTRTLAIARFGAGTSSGTPGPALDPDAILPPGTPLHSPPDPPPPDPNATSTGPIPRLTAGPGFPGGPRTPHDADDDGTGGSSGARRALLVAGGLVAALVLGGGGALAVTSLSGGSDDHKAAQTPPAPPPTHARPTPTPSKTRPKRKPKPVPVDIRDEKKDPRPLTIGEVFPDSQVKLAGMTFNRVKTVINDHCSLTANGPFATELTGQHCRRVVRATFVSSDKKIAVTTGIAVMPTDAAAKAALKTQDPAHYKWFRGMKAPGAPKIDQAGGFAASTLRGRYIIYAYATYADGHKPAAKDDTLKKVGAAFRDSTARPIERRARAH